jgi:hypothetical protein
MIDPAIVARAEGAGESLDDFLRNAMPRGAMTIHGAEHPPGWPGGTSSWAEPPIQTAGRTFDNGVPAAPDMELGTPLWDQMNKSAGAADNLLKGRTNNLRNQPFARPAQAAMQNANAKAAKMQEAMRASAQRGEVMQDVGQMAGAAAGAGLLGAGAVALMPRGASEPKRYKTDVDMPGQTTAKPPVDPLFDEKAKLTSTDGAAELADQSRPVPSVPTSDDPREQAQALIAQLNQMRRQAGGEVPEAPKMMSQINSLLALSDKTRNAMAPQTPQGAAGPHMQAQALLAQLNQMRQQAGGEVPQAPQIMAEVRRLQALGDQQRNAAQTR